MSRIIKWFARKTNELCKPPTSIVKARYFAAPLKFLIRGSYAVSFTRGKKKRKAESQEFCSLLRVPPFSKPSARSFVKRWSLAGLTSSSRPRPTFYYAAVSSRSSREKLRFIHPLDLRRSDILRAILQESKEPFSFHFKSSRHFTTSRSTALFRAGMLTSKFSLGSENI